MPSFLSELKAFIETTGEKGVARVRAITYYEVTTGLNFAEAVGLFPFQLALNDAQAIASGNPYAIGSVGLAVTSKVLVVKGHPYLAVATGVGSWALYALQHIDNVVKPGQQPVAIIPGQNGTLINIPPMWLKDP